MHRHNSKWRAPGIAALVVTGLAAWWAADLWADPPAQVPAGFPQSKHGLKTFRLTFTDPEEMKMVLEQVLPMVPDLQSQFLGGMGMMGLGGAGGALGMLGGNIGNVPGAQLGGAGALGALGMMGGGFAGMGGGFGGGMGGGLPNVQIAVAKRVQAVLVRGDDRVLKVAADLVAVLDTAPGKPLPNVKHVGIFSLKHADADQVKDILEQVGFQVVALPPVKLIIAPDMSVVEDVESAIRELDAPTRPALPEGKRKKLLLVPDAAS